MTRAVFDIDFILFAAASVAEDKYITATHIPSGLTQEFKTQTELWGHWKKKVGGWIGLQNEMAGEIIYKAEDFVVVHGQRPRPFRVKGIDGAPDTFLTPLEGAKRAVVEKINAICGKLMVESYWGYTGRGKVFRHDLATLLPYKGNRDEMLSPIILNELKEWACSELNISWVEGIEADDAYSIATVAGYKAWIEGGKQDEDKVIGIAIDKDSKQTNGWHFNPNKDDQPRLIEGFGSLWLDKKEEVDGCGRMWLYWQVAHGDDTDNYISNCFSDIAYAGKGAYNDLVDCKTDKEAFTKLVEIFKRLYPEKKTVQGCKGEVEIDWLYVFQEMWDLAMMLRHDKQPRDRVNVKATLDKLGVEY